MFKDFFGFTSYDGDLPRKQRPSKWKDIFDKFLASDDRCIRKTFSELADAENERIVAYRYIKRNKLENIRVVRRGNSVFIVKE